MKALWCGPYLAFGLVAAPAPALDLTPSARTALGEEVRALLLEEPEILERALNPPPLDPYEDDRAADLARIAAHGAALFGEWPASRIIAFFEGPDCADCPRARAELDAIAGARGWRVLRHPIDSALARSMELPDAPFYVLNDMLIRGWMPAPVLDGYLSAR